MTKKEIEDRIKEIADYAGNAIPEQAHLLEEKLYLDFIRYVAEESPVPEIRERAGMVLAVRDLDFPRWYT